MSFNYETFESIVNQLIESKMYSQHGNFDKATEWKFLNGYSNVQFKLAGEGNTNNFLLMIRNSNQVGEYPHLSIFFGYNILQLFGAKNQLRYSVEFSHYSYYEDGEKGKIEFPNIFDQGGGNFFSHKVEISFWG